MTSIDPSATGDQSTRQRLLDAATRLLIKGGAESLSLSGVARLAGVTRQGIYYHFDNKEELLNGVRAQLNEQLVRIAKGSEKIENVYSFPAELAAEEEELVYLRILEMLEKGPGEDVLITTRKKVFASNFELGRLQSDVDVEMAAIIASTSLISAYVVVSAGKTKKKRHELAGKFGQAYFQLLFHGLVKPGPKSDWLNAPAYKYGAGSGAEKPTGESLPDAAFEEEVHLGQESGSPAVKEALLREAITIIRDMGDKNLTLSEIAQRIGVSRQGLYYHFDNRESLFRFIDEAMRARILEQIDGAFCWNDAAVLAENFASRPQHLLMLRLRKMLEWRTEVDPLIRHNRAIFQWYRKQEYLSRDVEPDTAAVLVTVTFFSAMVMALSQQTDLTDRKIVAQRVTNTYQRLLHYGVLDLQSYPNWPRP